MINNSNMQTTSSVKICIRTVIIDIVLISLLCMTPAVAHLVGISYHYFEPMRIALFMGLLLVDDRKNGYLLAAILPISTMILSGMPTPTICALMVLELMLNIYLFHLVSSLTRSAFWGMFIGVIVSKVVYRLMKWSALSNEMFQASALIENWQLQLIMSVVLSVGFVVIYKLKQR